MSEYVALHHVTYAHGPKDALERGEARVGEKLHPTAHPDDIAVLLKLGAIEATAKAAEKATAKAAKE